MNKLNSLILSAAFALVFTGYAQSEEVVLRAVTGLPAPSPVCQVFLEYVKKVNERGAGIVRIDYIGGPEATPPARQGAALERGIIDILHAPASFYAGSVKEVDALLSVNRPISEIRANGAFDLINELWGDQLNAHLIGWFDSTVEFNMYLTKEPEVTDDGVSLAGMKLFTTPTYRDFQAALGATPVAMGVGEIMTGLDRGVIDGFGWPDYGLVALGFGRVAKYRIDPGYYSGNVLALINKDRWDSLPQPARDVLNEVAIEWEAGAKDFIANIKKTEQAELTAGGMQIIDLPQSAAEAYRSLAYGVLEDRLAASGSPKARELFDLLHAPE